MVVFVVIPAYNEEKAIGQVVADVHKILAPRSIAAPLRSLVRRAGEVGCSNIIVVDDGSADETGKAAEMAGAIVLRHIINRGQGAALRTGINYALSRGADIIVTYDADGQFEAGDISKICEPIISGEADVVLGSRFLTSPLVIPESPQAISGIPSKKQEVPIFKKIVLKSAILFTRAVTGMKLSDTHNGFRAMNREAAGKINIRQDRMAHSSEIIHEIARLGLKYKEMPVMVNYTDYSKKKGQKLTGALKILFDLIMK